MKNTYEITVAIIVAVITSSAFWLAVAVLPLGRGINEYRKQAVDRGFAYWKITDASTGATEFSWAEPTNLLDQLEKPLAKEKK